MFNCIQRQQDHDWKKNKLRILHIDLFKKFLASTSCSSSVSHFNRSVSLFIGLREGLEGEPGHLLGSCGSVAACIENLGAFEYLKNSCFEKSSIVTTLTFHFSCSNKFLLNCFRCSAAFSGSKIMAGRRKNFSFYTSIFYVSCLENLQLFHRVLIMVFQNLKDCMKGWGTRTFVRYLWISCSLYLTTAALKERNP